MAAGINEVTDADIDVTLQRANITNPATWREKSSSL